MKQLSLLLYIGLATAQAETLQDPTRPIIKPIITEPVATGVVATKPILNTDQVQNSYVPMALKLTAIIDINQNKQAIINGMSFTQGQIIHGQQLILISQNHVKLDGSDGPQTLFVNSKNIKKVINNVY